MRTTVLLLVILSACTSARPILREGDSGESPFPPRTGRLPADTMTRASWPQSPAPASAARQQRICRTREVPNGWAITAYEMSHGGSCVWSGRENDYNIAVIEDLTRYPLDTVIGICADQRIPSGWLLQHNEQPFECVGARVTAGSPTGMMIRRNLRR